MARFSGVTYQDIVNAANQIIGQGMQPTIEKIRHILKTGSSTTIANYLRKWRVEQAGSAELAMKEELPQELIAMMKGLWEHVLDQARAKITVMESKHQEVCAELQQDLDKYKNNNQRWQQMYNQWIKEKAQLSNDKLGLEQALASLQKNALGLEVKQDALLQQLTEKQDRIDELNKLHQQTQANLEHYRESSREQRLLDQQQYEQQVQTYQTEIKMFKDQLTVAREKGAEWQQQYQALNQIHLQLDEKHVNLIGKFEKQQLTLAESEKMKNEFIQTSMHWQNQYKLMQQNLETSATQLINSLAEIKLLEQKFLTAQQSLEDAIEQNKLLGHERWILAQEKAQLEGQLKQMQKIANVLQEKLS